MDSETKKCPYCGKEIKLAAKKCRYCGEWLEENKRPQYKQRSNTISEDNALNAETPNAVESEDGVGELHPNKIGFFIIASLVVIGIICFFVVDRNSSHSSDDYYSSDTIVAEEMAYEYNTAVEETSVQANDDSGVCPYDGVPDEDDYNASVALMRYSKKYDEINTADIHLMYRDGKKLWYNYWQEGSGYDNKLYVYDSETNQETTVRLNKTNMPDGEMEVSDMIAGDGGVLTIIMTENRNSNGWIEGTYVWQYFCTTGSWQALATECSGAEFIKNRTAVKVSYAESKNPDDPVYMQEYRYTHRIFNL